MEDKCFMEKELHLIGNVRSLGETKPIPARTVVEEAGKGVPMPLVGPIVPNKPNGPQAGREGANAGTARPKRAKRSQFPAGVSATPRRPRNNGPAPGRESVIDEVGQMR